MRVIFLTRGLVTVVDDEDFERFGHLSWHATPAEQVGERYYAARAATILGRSKTQYLHREILCAPSDLTVDHVDGDGLDNRRVNIRLATRAQNNANREVFNSTGYRGVNRDGLRFRAGISRPRTPGVKTAKIHLGLFLTAEAAARAYDAAAIEMFGEFARLNFPKQAAA